LQLLIVPVAVALLGAWTTAEQNTRQEWAEIRREEESAQDDALEGYFALMGTLLADEELTLAPENSPVRRQARLQAQRQTIQIIQRVSSSSELGRGESMLPSFLLGQDPRDEYATYLGEDRRGHVLSFLHEAALLNDNEPPLVDLREADLRGINLSWAEFDEDNLSKLDLEAASLQGTNLSGTDLRNANLQNAHLSGADLSMPSWTVQRG